MVDALNPKSAASESDPPLLSCGSSPTVAVPSTLPMSIPSGRQPAGSWRANYPLAIGLPPSCRCGCGHAVKAFRGRWNFFLPSHWIRTRRMTIMERTVMSERMRVSNPMTRPQIAAKAGQTRKGRPLKRSAIGIANISRAAKRRMLSDANPMKDAATARRVHAQNLSRETPSKNEQTFFEEATRRGIVLKATGAGTMWIARRNPDFRVPGQKKVIEVTQAECFVNRGVPRTPEGYAYPTIRHYQKHGWNCLVVYRKHKCVDAERLWGVLAEFVKPTSQWRGVWLLNGSLISW